MNNDIESVIQHMKTHGFKMGKSVTCGGCTAFVVRDNEYHCFLKPFQCDDGGHPMMKCPKPLTQKNLKKAKFFLENYKKENFL